MSYQSINPNDGKTLKSYDEMSDQQLDAAIATAETCFASWKKKSYAERAIIVA